MKSIEQELKDKTIKQQDEIKREIIELRKNNKGPKQYHYRCNK